MKTKIIAVSLCALLGVSEWTMGSTTQEVLNVLAEPQPVVQVNATERGTALPALRYMPADAEGVIAMVRRDDSPLCNVLFDELFKSGIKSEGKENGVGSLAISLGRGTGETIKNFKSLLSTDTETSDGSQLLDLWIQNPQDNNYPAVDPDGTAEELGDDGGATHEDIDAPQPLSVAAQMRRDIIGGILAKARREQLAFTEKMLSELTIAPIYIALTPHPGKEKEFAEWCADTMASVTHCDEGDTPEQVGDFRGVSTSLARLIDRYLDDRQLDEQTASILRESVKEKRLYVLAKQEEAALLICVCQNPAQMQFPQSIQESAVTTRHLTDMDAHARDTEVVLWLGSDIMQRFNLDDTGSVLWCVQEVFSVYAQKDAPNAPVYEAAARGVERLGRFFDSFPSYEGEVSLIIWKEQKNYRADFYCASMGARPHSGTLPRLALADTSGASFYIGTTGWDTPFVWDGDGLLDAVLDVAAGYVLTLEEEQKDRSALAISIAKMLCPDLINLGTHLCAISDALRGEKALAIFNLPGSDDQKEVHAAASMAVRDRSALEKGWQDALSSLKAITAKLGYDPTMLDHLPIVKKDLADGSTELTLAVTFRNFLDDVQPQILLSSTEMALVDAPKTMPILQRAQHSTPFAGTAFVLRPGERSLSRDELSNLKAVYGVSVQQGERIRTSILWETKTP